MFTSVAVQVAASHSTGEIARAAFGKPNLIRAGIKKIASLLLSQLLGETVKSYMSLGRGQYGTISEFLHINLNEPPPLLVVEVVSPSTKADDHRSRGYARSTFDHDDIVNADCGQSGVNRNALQIGCAGVPRCMNRVGGDIATTRR